MKLEYINSEFERAIMAITGSNGNIKRIKLSKQEISILENARILCSKIGDIQTKLNAAYDFEDCDNNDYSWAEIYLRNIIEEAKNEIHSIHN